MPILEYRCEAGHVSEDLVPLNEVSEPRRQSIPCEKCAASGEVELATRVLSATKTTFRHADRKAFK